MTRNNGIILKRGSPDVASVKEWQSFLKSQGLYSGKVDGDFGGRTAAATKEFQRRQGVGVDGIVGWRTQTEARRVQGLIPIPRANPGNEPAPVAPAADKPDAKPLTRKQKQIQNSLETRRRSAPAFPDGKGGAVLGDYPEWVRARAANSRWIFDALTRAESLADPEGRAKAAATRRLTEDLTKPGDPALRDAQALDRRQRDQTSGAVPLSPADAAALPVDRISEPVRGPGDFSEFPQHIQDRVKVDSSLSDMLKRMQRERIADPMTGNSPLAGVGQYNPDSNTDNPMVQRFRDAFDPIPQ